MLGLPLATKIFPLLLGGWLAISGWMMPLYLGSHKVVVNDSHYVIIEDNVEVYVDKDDLEITTIIVNRDKNNIYVWDIWEHPEDIREYLTPKEKNIIDKWQTKIENLDTDSKVNHFKNYLEKVNKK